MGIYCILLETKKGMVINYERTDFINYREKQQNRFA